MTLITYYKFGEPLAKFLQELLMTYEAENPRENMKRMAAKRISRKQV